MDFADRHAVVTGGSSGIGLAIAVALARRGAHVHLVARRREPLERAADHVRQAAPDRTVTARPCDVGSAGAVVGLFDALEGGGTTPSVLVNSAGVSRPGYFEKLDLSAFEESIRINYLGTVYATHALVPRLIERGDGYVVNVSSVAGLMGVFGYTAYAASKFAVTGFTESLRSELKPKGIGVSLLCPPDTDTPMLRHEAEHLPPETAALNAEAGVLEAAQVAEALMRGMSKRRAVIVPGRDARTAVLAHRLAPRLVERIIDRKLAAARRKSQNQ